MDCEAIRLQSLSQLGWVAHRDHVTAVDLVDFEAQPLTGDPPLDVEREHPIVAAGQNARRDIGPRRQRPWFIQRPDRLVLPRSRLRLGPELGRQVVVVDDGIVLGLVW
jgi:hypothetical protein